MKFRFSIFFVLLVFIAACSTPPTPPAPTNVPNVLPPTADAAATEAAIAQKIFTTLTASAPQPTVTPPPLPNATATVPPLPTAPVPTLVVNLSPSVTPISVPPTRGTTRAIVAPTQPTLTVSREALLGKIVFKSTRAGGRYPSQFNFFVMDADGSNVQQLLRDPAAELHQSQIENAGFSPDRALLVVGERTCNPTGHCDLYIASPELAATRSQGQWTSGPNFSRADQPVWSPDGNWVAFTWNLTNDRTKNIFKGNPALTNQNFKRLTDFGGQPDTKSPTYSPDGSMLAFATNSVGNRWQIWVLSALAENFTDAQAHSVGNGEADDWDPVWIK